MNQSAQWAEAQRIADLPSVTEVLLGFSEDSTNDNAVCLVQEVLKAHRTEVLAELSDESAMWTINEQIKGLLEGDGASEDHEAVVDFLLGAGLPLDTVKRVHKALSCAEKPPKPVVGYLYQCRKKPELRDFRFRGRDIGLESMGYKAYALTLANPEEPPDAKPQV